MSINRYICTGNLTRDPERRATSNGTTVMRFGIAVNDRRKDKGTGEWVDKPNFLDCEMYGDRADMLLNILRKGMKVGLQGKLDWHSWEDKLTGKMRSAITVSVDDVEFLEPPEKRKQEHKPDSEPEQPYSDSDIPF